VIRNLKKRLKYTAIFVLKIY